MYLIHLLLYVNIFYNIYQWNWLFHVISFYSSELGPGWSPAYLETQREIDIIRAAEERFFSTNNGDDYWVAGSVNLDISPDNYSTCTFNVAKSGNSRPNLYISCFIFTFLFSILSDVNKSCNWRNWRKTYL